MALTSAWTADMADSEIPPGAVIPTVAELEGTVFTQDFDINLSPASTYDNDNLVTAFAAVGAATKTALDTYVIATLGLEAAQNPTARYVIKYVQRRHSGFAPGDYVNQYMATTTDIFRVTGEIQWQS